MDGGDEGGAEAAPVRCSSFPTPAGPAHQFDRYYKDGDVDNCSRQFSEFRFCWKLKMAGPEETKVGGVEG